VPRNNTFFFRACARFVTTAWYVDLRFKQKADTEFSVAEKESAMNFQKLINVYTVSMLLIKEVLIVEFTKCRF
jgi:hypothetical protein